MAVASAHVQVSQEVAEVIRRSNVAGDRLTLPAQLDRKQYVAVDKVLSALGAAWNRSAKAHVFAPGTAAEKLSPILHGQAAAVEKIQVVDRKKLLQQFYTPRDVAVTVVGMADVGGHVVLEPSAGGGALAVMCRDCGAKEVTCVDIDRRSVDGLIASGFEAYCFDFLDESASLGQFSRVVMNPPFTKNQDVKHVRRALQLLVPGGILTAIMPASTGRKVFKDLLSGSPEWSWIDLPAGSFRESGTDVRTGVLQIFS